MGVIKVELFGCNDLQIEGKKFFGNVMWIVYGWMFFYGILMYDVDFDVIGYVFNVFKDKIEFKGIKLVYSWVINLKFYFMLDYQYLMIEEFCDMLVKKIFGVSDLVDVKEYVLSDEDKVVVVKINVEIFSNWDFVYGKLFKVVI